MYDEVLSVAQVVASVLFLIGIGLIVKPAKASNTQATTKLAEQK